MKHIAHIFAVVFLAPSLGLAATCFVDIDSTDQMQFDKKAILVPASCKTFTVNLGHSGKLPRNVMGHNWVLSETAVMKSVAADGISAGAANSYVKPGDARVIAASKLIGGGERDSVSFETSRLKTGTEYSYFCTFPGHVLLMSGTLAFGK